MKTHVLVLVCTVLTLSVALLAQTAAPPGHQMLADPERFADGHVYALDQQLHLSTDQKSKLRVVFLDEGKQLFALLNDAAMPADEKRTAIEKLHVQTEQKVGSLLTPEQRKQWAAPSPENRPTSSHTSQT